MKGVLYKENRDRQAEAHTSVKRACGKKVADNIRYPETIL